MENLPPPKPLLGTNVSVPYMFVGDEAFGLLTNLLRPYTLRNFASENGIFNCHLSRAHQYVECLYIRHFVKQLANIL
jgi:hypothetical protein